ncbi:hypothetical protein [Echinicola strongylocentroti]|nr:hypothetical protein [Echinicola strongylocentroti]
MEDKEDVNAFNTLLFFPVGEMEYEVYISRLYEYGGDKVFSAEDLTRYNFMSVPEAFSGTRMLFDWDEKPIGGWEYAKGNTSKIIKRVAKKQQDHKKANDYQQSRYDNQDSAEDSGTSSGGGSINYNCQYEIIRWYQVNPYGDDYYLGSDMYLECRFTEESSAPEKTSSNGGGYALPSNGHGPNPPQTDEACYDPHPTIPGMVVPCVPYEEDDYKIINNLTGKAACIYDKLINLRGGFRNAIQKFDGDFPVAHLKFQLGDLEKGFGVTIPPQTSEKDPVFHSEDYVITIKLDSGSDKEGVNQRPNLMVAKTIVHEVIHAEMVRKLMSLAGKPNFNSLTREKLENLLRQGDFPSMYEYYKKSRNWQHNLMADYFRGTIANILQEFDTGIAVPKGDKPDQLYLDLAWEGLRYNSAKSWNELGTVEQNRIKKVISDYLSNHKDEKCK